MTALISFIHLRVATQVIHDGGVIAYPTEGVFGLGCDPHDHDAVLRILELKERPADAGLILIAASRTQLDEWIDPSAAEERALSANSGFITWVVTAAAGCPDWITGGRPTCAVRITQHPIAAALCREADQALVSTSANRHGQRPATSTLAVRRTLGRRIDFILPGTIGTAPGASEIRLARNGAVLRAG